MFRGPATGLWTSPNPFSKVPNGSLKTADNVVFTAPSVIEPRRGFEAYSSFGTEDSLANALAFYGVNLLVAYDFTRVAIKPPGGEFFVWAETFGPNGANRLRFESAARSVFFNPSTGVRVFDGAVGFFTGTIVGATAAFRVLSYSGGVGSLDTSSAITGGTSGAEGTKPPGYTLDVAAGTMPFSVVTGGPFIDGEVLTGDDGWTGVAVGAETPAVVIGDYTAAFVAGLNIAGQTSGAIAVINTVGPIAPPFAWLGLREVAGTFVAETIAVGESTLEPTMAGCPQGLNIAAVQSYDDGWQTPNTAVAYRFTICRKDAFGRIIEGPPSGRVVVNNNFSVGPGFLVLTSNVVSGSLFPGVLTPALAEVIELLSPGQPPSFTPGSKTVTFSSSGTFAYAQTAANATSTVNIVFSRGSATANELTLYLPDDCTKQHFLRVYRSIETADAGDAPDDELFQCYESAYLSDAELAAGFLTFDDVAPESVLEVPLYTNANTGDGTLAANFRPPLAKDLVYWQNRMWYLNTTEKHSAQLSLIGTGAPDGLQPGMIVPADGDTITFLPAGGTLGVDDIVFLGVLAPPSAPGEFQVSIYEDPGTNIQVTAQNLAQAINDSAEAGLPYAFYVSSETGTPGKLLLQAREFGDAAGFSVYSSRPTAWTPQLPDAAAPLWPALQSVDNAHAARLSYSKLGQPEAVPLLNYEQVDADDYPALKMAALNYRLIIFKTDGVYFVPTGFPLSLQRLSNHVLIAPDSVQRLDDSIFFLSDQGLMVVDESGVHPASIPIDDALQVLGAPVALTDLAERTVGLTYRSEKRYQLWTIERDDLGEFSADTAQAFVYSTEANGFTRFTFGVRAGAISPRDFADGGDRLLVAPTDSNTLWLERKTLTADDYYDVGPAPDTQVAIETEVLFNELTNEQPATMKMAQQASFLFRQNSAIEVEALFASEIHPSLVPVSLATAAWGEFSWGEIPWGGYIRTIRRVEPLPVEVGNCCQLVVGFRASVAGTRFAFLGIDVDTKKDSKANRG